MSEQLAISAMKRVTAF